VELIHMMFINTSVINISVIDLFYKLTT
jgi:hypothetical protein